MISSPQVQLLDELFWWREASVASRCWLILRQK